MCASHWACYETRERRNESEGRIRCGRGGMLSATLPAAAPPARLVSLAVRRSMSTHAGTRKMVNYA